MSSNFLIELKNVGKRYGDHQVLSGFSLAVSENCIVSLLGESGSGKTTCLRLINGLIAADEGEVWLDGDLLDTDHSTHLRRKMGYSIQGSGLFPHMNTEENISIIARREKWTEKKIEHRVREVLEMVQLDPEEVRKKKPREMSGGQRQRVGIARALFMKPKVMIMDEPFGALDPITRDQIQDLFLKLQKDLSLCVVLVTHDIEEALKMSDQVVLLNKGSVEQVAAPDEMLNSPASSFVREFFQSYKNRVRYSD